MHTIWKVPDRDDVRFCKNEALLAQSSRIMPETEIQNIGKFCDMYGRHAKRRDTLPILFQKGIQPLTLLTRTLT